MKQWLKLAFVGAALLMFSALGAQPGPLNREGMRNELQLRPEQEERFFAAMKKSAEAMRMLRSNAEMGPEQRRTEARKIAKAHQEEMATILSKEQMDKWTTLRQERRRKPGPRPPFPGQHPPAAQRGRPVPNQELAQAVRVYSEKEIFPVLKRERAGLEKQMSPKDQQTLASLRTQGKAMGRPFGGMMRPGPPAGRPKAPVNPELNRLAEKYRSEINRIFARMEPQVDRWNKDLRALQEKYAPPQKGPGSRKGPGPLMPSAAWLVHPQRFLLLDPHV